MSYFKFFFFKTLKRLDPPIVEDILLEKTQNGLGFSISGGLFTEHLFNDNGIFITKIIRGGAADLDGRLNVGDRLLTVNGISLEYVTHDDAVAAIASSIEKSNQILLRVAKVNQYYQTQPLQAKANINNLEGLNASHNNLLNDSNSK